MTYRELEEAAYSGLRSRLIKSKGSSLQKEFLNVLKNSDRFIEWLESQVGVVAKGKDFDLVADQLTEHEFKEPPAKVEHELFKKWHAITPAQACRSTFWGYITLRHIKESKIESFFLAANGGNLPGGEERIDAALKEGKSESIDAIVRTALRRFSGLPEARGNRTVSVDCPFGRAWWRCHIAEKVCGITKAEADQVIQVLRMSQAYWEGLVSSVVSRNSVFGDEKIRAALIWSLSERVKKEKKKSALFSSKTLDNIIKRIGVRLAWQELAVFEPNELKVLFESEYLA